MLSRRDLIMSGAFASRLRPAPAPASNDLTKDDLNEIRDALLSVGHLTASSDIAQIRDLQRTHFKLNQKLPDYIDIGIQVWERLYAWHLENHVSLQADRGSTGRMEMQVMFTTLVLRHDVADSYIGQPYDR